MQYLIKSKQKPTSIRHCNFMNMYSKFINHVRFLKIFHLTG